MQINGLTGTSLRLVPGGCAEADPYSACGASDPCARRRVGVRFSAPNCTSRSAVQSPNNKRDEEQLWTPIRTNRNQHVRKNSKQWILLSLSCHRCSANRGWTALCMNRLPLSMIVIGVCV